MPPICTVEIYFDVLIIIMQLLQTDLMSQWEALTHRLGTQRHTSQLFRNVEYIVVHFFQDLETLRLSIRPFSVLPSLSPPFLCYLFDVL